MGISIGYGTSRGGTLMDALSYQDFNKFLDENEIDIEPAVFGDDVFLKMMEVFAWQNKRMTALEIRIGEVENG